MDLTSHGLGQISVTVLLRSLFPFPCCGKIVDAALLSAAFAVEPLPYESVPASSSPSRDFLAIPSVFLLSLSLSTADVEIDLFNNGAEG